MDEPSQADPRRGAGVGGARLLGSRAGAPYAGHERARGIDRVRAGGGRDRPPARRSQPRDPWSPAAGHCTHLARRRRRREAPAGRGRRRRSRRRTRPVLDGGRLLQHHRRLPRRRGLRPRRRVDRGRARLLPVVVPWALPRELRGGHEVQGSPHRSRGRGRACERGAAELVAACRGRGVLRAGRDPHAARRPTPRPSSRSGTPTSSGARPSPDSRCSGSCKGTRRPHRPRSDALWPMRA